MANFDDQMKERVHGEKMGGCTCPVCFNGYDTAYIQGGNREATTNKVLYLIDPSNHQITKAGKEGFVDTQPSWSKQAPYDLLFLRGKETTAWEGKPQSGVLVPGSASGCVLPTGKNRR